MKDKNLKLAIIGQLMTAKVLPEFDIEAFFQEELHKDYDPNAEYNTKPIPEVFDALMAMELKEEDLLGITELKLNGANDGFFVVCPLWSGMDDYFAITSLDGIEALQNLEVLNIFGIFKHDAPIDLSCLTKLPKLRSLTISGGNINDLTVLNEIATLQELKVSFIKFEDRPDNHEVLRRFKVQEKERIDISDMGFKLDLN